MCKKNDSPPPVALTTFTLKTKYTKIHYDATSIKREHTKPKKVGRLISQRFSLSAVGEFFFFFLFQAEHIISIYLVELITNV